MTPALTHLRRVRGHTICTLGLGPTSVVVDAGAHRGEFSDSLMRRFGCEPHLIEAHPSLARELAARFSSVIPAALAAEAGFTQFFEDRNPEAGNIVCRNDPVGEPVTVPAATLSGIMQQLRLAHIDLLKLDVEGSEFDILLQTEAAVLRRISQISVEFHDFLSRPSYQGLYVKVRARLEALGFVCVPISIRTHGDVLFLDARRYNLERRIAAQSATKLAWALARLPWAG